MAKDSPVFIRLACTVYWAHLEVPTGDKEDTYQFDACKLGPKAIKALEEAGMEVKMKEKNPEMGMHITVKSKRPIRAVDETGEEVDGKTVGNGTKAIIVIAPYEWKYKNKTGVSAGHRRMTITDLVLYEGSEIDEDAIEDTLD